MFTHLPAALVAAVVTLAALVAALVAAGKLTGASPTAPAAGARRRRLSWPRGRDSRAGGWRVAHLAAAAARWRDSVPAPVRVTGALDSAGQGDRVTDRDSGHHGTGPGEPDRVTGARARGAHPHGTTLAPIGTNRV